MDMYKFAAQNKLRFPSVRGLLTVQDLFDLPLKARDGFDLNNVAKSIHNSLKIEGEESFVDDPADNPQRKLLEVALEIVKDVIKTKQEAAEASEKAFARAQKRRKILDAINAKQDQQLSEATIDDLEKQLAEL